MNKRISFAGPSITDKEITYVNDAIRNGWYENYDSHIVRLERAFAEYIGVRYAIATHCCTQALHLAAASLGLTVGDEVIVPEISWIATAYSIIYTGATCVFVDVDRDSWTIDPDAIRKAITPKTKAIMLVHTFGHPAAMDEIMEIAAKHRLYVIEDAAPAIGAEYKGKKVGSFGDIACFSFQGAKMTVSGEGGMYVTDDEQVYKKAKCLASMGRTDSKAVFWSDMLGYQYTIGNLTAALALAQLERVEELLERKRTIFGWYEQRLHGVPGIKLMTEKEHCKSSYCYPSILLQPSIEADRDWIIDQLKQHNIHCRPVFPRMSRFPLWNANLDHPVAQMAEERGISLPSAANLDEQDIEDVCQQLLRLIANYPQG